jgi:antitoxin component YwqK of YwqJK toxin-antitoxin module
LGACHAAAPGAAHVARVDADRLTVAGGVASLGAAPFTGVAVARRMDGGTRATGYVRGRRDGADTAWYASGRVAEVRWWAHDRETGRHRGWWPDGRPRFDFTYVDGRLEGRAAEWFANGRPYRELHYAAGHESGSQRMWFADGTLRASYVVRDGRRYGLMGAKGCVTTDSASGRGT